MAIDLVAKYLPYVDEVFTQESKKELLTNHDFTFDGAHTVKVYKISTAEMNDYGRYDAGMQRYGTPQSLDATTEVMTLKKDRSFAFVIDALDQDETAQSLNGASALARQLREVAIPEIDTYTYGVMTEGAGHKPAAVKLTAWLCTRFGLTSDQVIRHYDVTGKDCPKYYVENPDAWIQMKSDIAAQIQTDYALQGK